MMIYILQYQFEMKGNRLKYYMEENFIGPKEIMMDCEKTLENSLKKLEVLSEVYPASVGKPCNDIKRVLNLLKKYYGKEYYE